MLFIAGADYITRHFSAGVSLCPPADSEKKRHATSETGRRRSSRPDLQIATDVPKQQLSTAAVHASYRAFQKVERDFRTTKTGLLEIRPLFVRKESGTRGHVFCCLRALKLQRELDRRLAAVFGTTAPDPKAITVPDALAALGRRSVLLYDVNEKTAVTPLPKPDEHQRKILDALKASLPTK